MTQNTHCNFSCVLQIDRILSTAKDFSCLASIQPSPNTAINGVAYHEMIPVTINYWNTYDETFLKDAMILCIGTLIITRQRSDVPKLTVQSHCLIRFGYNSYIPCLNILITIVLLENRRMKHTHRQYLLQPMLF